MINNIVATNLKRFRKARGWSLAKTATETLVSKAMLGQIEREESSPTMVTLWKITLGMHIPISALLEPQVSELSNNDSALLNQSDKKVISFDNNIEFNVLFPFDAQLSNEMFSHRVQAQKTHLSNAHEKGVIEDIIVITGEIDILVEGQWKALKTGDTLRFCADQPHGYRNSSEQEAIFHNVIHYPHNVSNQ